MMTRSIRFIVLLLFLAASPACGPGVDLSTDLEITDVFSGYYDNGVKDGKNHLLPSISFRLKNVAEVPISGVQLTVSFWEEFADGEGDSSQVRGIGDDPLPPNGETEPILVRSSVGYLQPGPRETFFQNSRYRGFTAKVFARRAGRIVPIGEFKLDERIIPQLTSSPGGQ